MKKTLTLMLIGLMLNAVFYVSSVKAETTSDNSEKEAELVTKLKTGLNKIGIGENSKVTVKLHSGTKISGYLSEINEEDFVVVTQNNTSAKIPYDTVRSAKGHGRHRNFSCSKIALFSAILGGLLLALSKDSR